MKEIPLTQGKSTLVDDEDFEWLSRWKWYTIRIGRWSFYAARKIGPANDRVTVLMHRQILPTLLKIDHADGNGLNNQKWNLRMATNQQNSANRNRYSPGYKGVKVDYRDSRVYARIKVNGREIYLGKFDTQIEAAKAYNEAAIKYFGEFANLNRVEGY